MEDIVIKLPPTKYTEFTDTDNIIGYDVLEFINDFTDLIKQYLDATNKFPGYDINASAAYEDIRENASVALRYKILERNFGEFSSTSPNKKSQLRNIRWMKIAEEEDPKYPNYKVVIKKQVFDYYRWIFTNICKKGFVGIKISW